MYIEKAEVNKLLRLTERPQVCLHKQKPVGEVINIITDILLFVNFLKKSRIIKGIIQKS